MSSDAPQTKRKRIGIVVYDGFETLDVFGPVQMWGRLPDHAVVLVSQDGKPVRSSQGVTTEVAHSFADAPQVDVLMVPGGMGARREVDNPALLAFLRKQSAGARGRPRSARAQRCSPRRGCSTDGRRPPTRSRSFGRPASPPRVKWQRRARWVVDGPVMTSSGVSAGTDMALALVERLYDRKTAEEAARTAEYAWNDDPANDPFAGAGSD